MRHPALMLIAHDLRLAGRRISTMVRGGSGRRTLLFVGLAIVLFHALAWPVALEMADITLRNPRGADGFVAAGLLFVMPWIVSQALTNATRSLYSRGDLDLLLASPVPPAAIFAARAMSIAVESVISVAIFLLPVADALAIAAGPRWLVLYPMLAICGLAGTGLGLLLTLALFHVAGPRRTRVLSQVLATIVGASFALGIQAISFVPPAWREAFRTVAGEGVLAVPVRAATGDLLALAVCAAVSLALFAAVCVFLGVAFTRGLVRAADTAAPARSRATARRFRTGANASLRRKEWRLLRRDPWLASQMLLQAAYTVPLCFVLWQTLGPQQGLAAALGPAVVVIAAQLSGALAWVTLSSEDAPEFLQTAPLAPGVVSRAKLSAVAMPLAAVLAVPIAGMAWSAPASALATAVFAAGGAASTALLNVWRQAPGRRGDLLRRQGQSKLVGILEHALALFWAVAIALYSAGSWLFLPAVGLAVALLAATRPAGAIFRRGGTPQLARDRSRSVQRR